jgi:hypothetical protein
MRFGMVPDVLLVFHAVEDCYGRGCVFCACPGALAFSELWASAGTSCSCHNFAV